jgi:ribosomal protein L11 methylase PrmA
LSVAPFIATPEKMVRQMLDLAKLRRGEVLYDLGSGDGIIAIIAAKDYGAKAIGIELDPTRAETARKQNVAGVIILTADFFDVDLSNADVVTCYLTEAPMQRLGKKLSDELKQAARIVSHNYEIPNWHHATIESCPSFTGHRLILYEFGKP